MALFKIAQAVSIERSMPKGDSDERSRIDMHTSEQPKNQINPPTRVELYQRALVLLAREQDTASWAALQILLAESLHRDPFGERAVNLDEAIQSYARAVEVYTREAFPEDWAATQYSLGAAYQKRIRGDRAENLERAIEHCGLALE